MSKKGVGSWSWFYVFKKAANKWLFVSKTLSYALVFKKSTYLVLKILMVWCIFSRSVVFGKDEGGAAGAGEGGAAGAGAGARRWCSPFLQQHCPILATQGHQVHSGKEVRPQWPCYTSFLVFKIKCKLLYSSNILPHHHPPFCFAANKLQFCNVLQLLQESLRNQQFPANWNDAHTVCPKQPPPVH